MVCSRQSNLFPHKKNAIPGVGLSFFLGLIRPARRRNRILSVILNVFKIWEL